MVDRLYPLGWNCQIFKGQMKWIYEKMVEWFVEIRLTLSGCQAEQMLAFLLYAMVNYRKLMLILWSFAESS